MYVDPRLDPKIHFLPAITSRVLPPVSHRASQPVREKFMFSTKFFVPAAAIVFFASAAPALAQTDPGVQGGAARAGGPLPGLTANELSFFNAGDDDFEE